MPNDFMSGITDKVFMLHIACKHKWTTTGAIGEEMPPKCKVLEGYFWAYSSIYIEQQLAYKMWDMRKWHQSVISTVSTKVRR